jgi:osmotically-inducible protein OsmY
MNADRIEGGPEPRRFSEARAQDAGASTPASTSLEGLERGSDHAENAAERRHIRASSGEWEAAQQNPLSAQDATERIRHTLNRHPDIDASGLEIEWADGEARLLGCVPSEADKLGILRVVQTVPGVVSISDELEVQRQD